MNIEKKNILIIYGSIAVISIFHYYTSTGYHYFHDIYRRLYYIPIILAAFKYGTRGGLLASICTSVIYVPHAFWHVQHMDPARTMEKVLEIVLYNVIAVVTGVLATREKQSKERHRQTAQELETSLNELKSMEQDLVRAEKLSAIGQLTAGLAHEIRNPLGSIKGSAEILAGDYSPRDKKYKMSQILIKEVDRLNKVLTNFLAFARPTPLELVASDILQEIEYVIKFLESQAQTTGVKISRPQVCELPLLYVDREKMRQVFLNLMLNAIQAMPGGGEISIGVGKSGQKGVIISISDTGTGISKEDLPNLFNPFFTTKKDGSGLGLAISYKIIQEHGGGIRVESEKGRGSRFTIVLPTRPIHKFSVIA